MLLNLFFDNMNSTVEVLLLIVFFVALYVFVLRKSNSLGLRMFILCFLMFIAFCVWIYKDEVKLKNTIATGEERIATVIAKSKTGKNNGNNEVEVSFAGQDNKTITVKTSDYVSQQEWEKFEPGKPLSVLYVPSGNQVFVQQSIMRFKADKIYLYYFAAVWLVLGVVVYLWLRKLKVGVDENGNEWVIKEDGSVTLDERKSGVMRATKRANMISKFLQVFGK